MNRAAAIVLSLLLLWLQALASAPSNFTNAAAPADRCACSKPCCVSRSTSDAQPRPLAPASGSPTPDFSAWLVTAVAWTLPAASSSHQFSFDSAPSPVPAVPLFTWHCALLI